MEITLGNNAIGGNNVTIWEFAVKGNQRERNPVQDEFFNAPDTLTDVSALVREAVQNSLDARLDDSQPVKVVFTLGHKPKGSGHAEFFSGLQGHLDEVFGAEKSVTLEDEMNYLLVEDFNTTGLTGSTKVSSVPTGANPADCSYTYFIHIEGEGSKGDGKRGKWGVGKIVFPRLSKAKSFFAYSIRNQQNAPDGLTKVCIGQSILKFHNFNNARVQPDGWFGTFTNDVFEPLDAERTEKFADFWDLKRTVETGLTILVPYVSDSISSNEIRDALIRQYFVAIIDGTLVCEINTQSGTLKLDKDGLVAEAPKIEMERAALLDRTAVEMKAAIDVVLANSNSECESQVITIADSIKALTEISLEEDELEQLRKKLNSGNPVKVIVTLSAPDGNTGSLIPDNFQILLQQLDNVRSAPIYSREGIIVPGTGTRRLAGFTSVVLVSPGPIANVLGLAEGPAHEKWSQDTKKFREIHGSSIKATRLITLVRGLPGKLVDLAVAQSGAFDSRALARWIRLPEDSHNLGDGERPVKPKPPILPAKPNPFEMYPIKGGFVIKRGSAALEAGSLIRVDAAYSRSKGDAFNNWKRADFSLESGFTVDYENSKETYKRDNIIQFEITDIDWEVRCTGFSELLDIELRPVVLGYGSSKPNTKEEA